ncbi:MAG TPA: DUF4349 domain-containing protein [Candidatus Dormibacteraeota bacterium]|jgi:hypothetical protein
MNRTKLALLLSTSLLALLLAAACAGAESGPKSTAASTSGRAGAAQVAPAPAGDAGAAAKPSAGPAADVIPNLTVPEGPRVQRSARISLQVPDGRFDSALNDVISIVDQAGGYIAGSDVQAADQGQPLRSGQATFQVPSDKLDQVLTDVRKKGTPESISVSGNDVTTQYVDLQARLVNAQAQRDAMLALMQQARTVADTIQIQNQLGQVTAQIEQLKGQINYLDHSTSFATLSVRITEATAGPSDEWGLRSAFDQALHNLVGVLAFLVLALGTLIPVAVAGGILYLIGRVAWRRWGRRPAPTAPVASPLAE